MRLISDAFSCEDSAIVWEQLVILTRVRWKWLLSSCGGLCFG